MKRPILQSGDARVLVYASKAGQNITAMDLIRGCENRIAHMKRELAHAGRMCVKVDKVATSTGDIEIIAKWVVLGEKPTKAVRRRNAVQQATERRAETPEGVQEGKGERVIL